ncbi:MAG: carbohydrate ABC transporter permease [Lachnospiraceae bacterium]|nr:carbohydrate ABC transporter permease [Lachnospiraceae bacterium]
MKQSFKSRITRIGMWICVILLCVISLFPFFWMVRSSLMNKTEIFGTPMKWWPKQVQWQNYRDALTQVPFARYFANSLFLVAVNIIGKLLSSSLVAFGFSRIEFKGKKIWFGIVIATMMIPWSVLLIPQFMLWNVVGLYNTYVPLTLPAFFLDGFYIFLLRQFFSTLPRDYDEAAIIDGASYFTIYSRIIMPLCKPALMTVCVFTFMNTWNDFIGPMIYLKDPKMSTVSLGLQMFISQYTTEWHLMMAAATVAIVPMIIMFFIAQRYFIEGMTFAGIKG